MQRVELSLKHPGNPDICATVELRLYMNARLMRAGMRHRDRKTGGHDDFTRVQGMFSPETVTVFDKGGKETTYKSLGILWLHREALGAGVVSHECLHLACEWMRRLPGHRRLVLGTDCGEAEEMLAHLLTGATRETYVALRRLGAL